MPRKQANPPAGEVITIVDGANGAFTLDIPTALVKTLAPLDYVSTGVVLVNAMQKLSIVHGDFPTNYTITLSIKRDAISNEERAACDDYKTAADRKKADQLKAEQEKREREMKAALSMQRELLEEGRKAGAADFTTSLQSIGAIVPALKAVQSLSAAIGGGNGQ